MLKLLLPAQALPPEGAPSFPTASNDPADLFRLVAKMVTKPPLRFRFGNSNGSKFEASAPEAEVTLDSVTLRNQNGEKPATVIEDSSDFAWWNARDVQDRVRIRANGNEFGSATEMADLLADELTEPERFEVTTELAADAGHTLVPVFRWSHEADKVSGQLLAFWLRPVDASFSDGTENDRLRTCRMVGISEEDEISGRALREMVASVVLLGLSAAPLTVAQAGTATGDAGPRQTTKSPHPSSSGHSLHRAKQRQSQSSTQQKPAKIYQDVLDRATPQNMHVTVSLSKQRVYLMVGDEIAIDSPISSGRAGRSTPTGSFTVTEKDKNHISTIYHCSMKYYLRLSGRSFGLHVGQLPGYPASHGCVRLPENVAQVLFERANIGTSVTIQA